MKKWQFITIVFVFLIAGLLNVYFAAQTTQGWTSSFSSFEVDGLRFNYHLSAYMVHPLNATSLIISPSLFPERNASSTFQTSTGGRTTVYAIIHVDAEEIRAKPDTLYFVQDGKIEIEKSYQELGIDASRLTGFMNGRNEIGDYLHYLQPILEQLIHEHVKPQEPEMEKTPERN